MTTSAFVGIPQVWQIINEAIMIEKARFEPTEDQRFTNGAKSKWDSKKATSSKHIAEPFEIRVTIYYGARNRKNIKEKFPLVIRGVRSREKGRDVRDVTEIEGISKLLSFWSRYDHSTKPGWTPARLRKICRKIHDAIGVERTGKFGMNLRYLQEALTAGR